MQNINYYDFSMTIEESIGKTQRIYLVKIGADGTVYRIPQSIMPEVTGGLANMAIDKTPVQPSTMGKTK